MNNANFKARYKNGDESFSAIYKHVDSWHKTHHKIPLWEYLGMRWKEYEILMIKGKEKLIERWRME